MSLHGNQSHYDRNGDGRLNTREWNNWYFATYGTDMEMVERRRAAAQRPSVQNEQLATIYDVCNDCLLDVSGLCGNFSDELQTKT